MFLFPTFKRYFADKIGGRKSELKYDSGGVEINDCTSKIARLYFLYI